MPKTQRAHKKAAEDGHKRLGEEVGAPIRFRLTRKFFEGMKTRVRLDKQLNLEEKYKLIYLIDTVMESKCRGGKK